MALLKVVLQNRRTKYKPSVTKEVLPLRILPDCCNKYAS